MHGSPFLTHLSLHHDRVQPDQHPFTIPLIENGLSLSFTTPVTFLVGENGSGKSTVLEALAWATGFGMYGGSRDHQFVSGDEGHALGRERALLERALAAETFVHSRMGRLARRYYAFYRLPLIGAPLRLARAAAGRVQRAVRR